MSTKPPSLNDANGLMEQAVEHYRCGRVQAAEPLVRDVLSRRKSWCPALNLLSIICLQSQRMDEGLALIDKSLKVDARQPEVHHNRGLALHQLGRYEQALASFDRAIAQRAHYAEAHCNRAITLAELGRFAPAVADYDKAISLKPDYATAFYNRAIALERLQRYHDSLDSYDRAIALEPRLAQAHCNRGGILETLGQLDAAMDSYDRAIALDPALADAQYNKSLLELQSGDFAHGWRRYEWRWQSALKSASRTFSQPLWLNDVSIEGRRLLVHAEQGYGDTLQFCRYIPLVHALGARLILQTPAPLVPLLQCLSGYCDIVPEGAGLPDFDFHCPLMSLPLAFGTTLDTIPRTVPYLRVDEARRAEWRNRLGTPTKRRVGIAWAGSRFHRRDHFRSMALALLGPLLTVDVEWHCVQKEIRPDDLASLGEHGRVRLHQDHLHDFSDAAALVDALDLVISVDSAPVHLAGALGKPIWILLSQPSDFRWLRERDDSPWYPTARLFRQRESGDWSTVVAAVGEQLRSHFP